MNIEIAEIKASCKDAESLHERLIALGADYKGIDHQVDTYYKVAKGRLKLRMGNIERNLISYFRPDDVSVKKSDVSFQSIDEKSRIPEILARNLEILVVVDKKRKIYFIDNVKFHIDEVKLLGSFMEIEAIGNETKDLSFQELQDQCKKYMDLLEIQKEDLIHQSYSDLLMLS